MSIRRGRVPPNRLRVWLAERRMTQFALSQKSGVVTSRISMIKNEHAEPTERERIVIARALKVDVAEIFPPVQEAVAS